jgi:hypothetical protein
MLVHQCLQFSILSGFDYQVRIQDFKLGRAHFKKLRRAEGGAKIVGVFRKTHNINPKPGMSHYIPCLIAEKSWIRYITDLSIVFLNTKSNRIKYICVEARKLLGYFVWKITILRKKITSFPILGGSAPGAPPGSAPDLGVAGTPVAQTLDVRPSVCKISAIRNSPDCNHTIDWR